MAAKAKSNLVEIIVPAGLPYARPAAVSAAASPSPFVLSWPVRPGQETSGPWVYVDTFTRSVTLGPPPARLAPPLFRSLSRADLARLVEQRILMPSGYDIWGEVLTYVEELRRHVFYLEVANTHRCDLACKGCYRLAPGVDHQHDMAPDTARRLVDWVSARLRVGTFGEFHVDFLGGEPLLAAAALLELVGEFRRVALGAGAEFRCSLVTNGTRLSEEFVSELADAGVTGFQLTFEGPPELHNDRRGVAPGEGGSFEAQVALMRRLAGLGLSARARPVGGGTGRLASAPLAVAVRVNYDRQNIASLPDLLTRLAELVEEGLLAPENLFISPLGKVFPSPHGHLDAQAFTPLGAARAMGPVVAARLNAGLGIAEADLVPENPCRFYLNEGYSVDALGRFYTCGSLFGSERSFATLDSPPTEPNWRRTDLTPECLDCRLLATCFGGCPSEGPVGEAGRSHCPKEFIEEYLHSVAVALACWHLKGSSSRRPAFGAPAPGHLGRKEGGPWSLSPTGTSSSTT